MDNKSLKELCPHRRSLRLSGYDYSWEGAYFVTFCTQDTVCLFGQVADNTMSLNQYGKIVASIWKEIPLHYPDIDNAIFIVMPNHIHGIVNILKSGLAGSKPATTRPFILSEIARSTNTCSSRQLFPFFETGSMPCRYTFHL